MCASQSKITMRIHGADTGGVEGYLVKTAVINDISALSSTWKQISLQHSKIPAALFGSKTRQLMSYLSCSPENKYLFCFHLKRNRKKPNINIFNWYLVLGTDVSVIFFIFTLKGLLSILLAFGSVISAKHKRIIMHCFTLLQADLQ